jgi:CRP/FNR family cyclic AMP-dependent transcriptional regulator
MPRPCRGAVQANGSQEPPKGSPVDSNDQSSPDFLAAEELREISRHAVKRRYPARAVVVTEGEKSDSLFIIVEGRAKAFVSDESGKEAVLTVMGPGEYFGEVALDEGPRSATVMTLEPCVFLVVSRSDFDEFVRANPAFASHFIRKLLKRIRVLTESVRSLALVDAYGRVARLLLERSVKEDGVQFVPGRLTQTEIASRVGCSREMVSRIFKDLVETGSISVRPDRIVIHRRPPGRW